MLLTGDRLFEMKILVVEDSGKIRKSLKAEFGKLGYAVALTIDGEQGLQLAQHFDYDLVVMDLMFPKMSGLDVLRKIRTSNQNPEILILSARDQTWDRVEGLELGADDYLVKPFSFDELHARIQALVRRRYQFKSPHIIVENLQIDTSLHSGVTESMHVPIESDNQPEELKPIARQFNPVLLEIEQEGIQISEVRLDSLINNTCETLAFEARAKSIEYRLPEQKLPRLLIDENWFGLMLLNLLTNAIAYSPVGSRIEIEFSSHNDRCSIQIKNPMTGTLSAEDLENIFDRFWRKDLARTVGQHGGIGLALVKSYAKLLDLEVKASMDQDEKFCVRVSNIKLIY